MATLKTLTVSLLLLFWAGCLHLRSNAPGVNSQEKSDEGIAAADYWTDEEQHMIQQRTEYDKLENQVIQDISSKIWKSVADLDVHYDGKLDATGKRRWLFRPKESTDNAIDRQHFKSLFEFYERETGYEDPCVSLNRSECDEAQNRFISHIFNANGPIRVLHGSLKDQGNFFPDDNAFKRYLKKIWFTPYSRTGGSIIDSSAFEHVFLGETSYSATLGLHNWMRMYEEEDSGKFELIKFYYPGSKSIVAKVQFKWHGRVPKWSNIFMRTSPATEIALYTLCFLTRPGKECQIELGNTLLFLHTDEMPVNKVKLIGTAYPVID